MKRRQTSMKWFPSQDWSKVHEGGDPKWDGDWIWAGHPLGDDEPHGDWLVACRVEPQDGRLVIAEIRVVPWPNGREEEQWVADSLEEPRPGVLVGDDGEEIGPSCVKPRTPDGGLTARAVRTIRTEPALESVCQTAGIMLGLKHSGPPPGFTRETLEAPRQPGRRGRSDRFYAEIAAAYVDAVDGKSRAPIRDVTRRLAGEGRHYSEPAVRDLVHDARRRGMLTKPPRGKAGGQLTDKALEILEEEDDDA